MHNGVLLCMNFTHGPKHALNMEPKPPKCTFGAPNPRDETPNRESSHQNPRSHVPTPGTPTTPSQQSSLNNIKLTIIPHSKTEVLWIQNRVKTLSVVYLCLSISLSLHPSIRLSFSLSLSLSLALSSVYLPIYLSIHIYLSIDCLSI